MNCPSCGSPDIQVLVKTAVLCRFGDGLEIVDNIDVMEQTISDNMIEGDHSCVCLACDHVWETSTHEIAEEIS